MRDAIQRQRYERRLAALFTLAVLLLMALARFLAPATADRPPGEPVPAVERAAP